MNYKIFYASVITVFTMLFWLIFQQGSLTFIAVRIVTAFLAAALMILSVTWDEPSGVKKGLLVLFIILGIGTVFYWIVGYLLIQHPIATIIGLAVIVVLGVLYIKYVEPKIHKGRHMKTH